MHGLVLAGGLFWLGRSNWMALAVVVLVMAVLNGYNGALSGIQNAARQRAIVAFHGGIEAWLRILLAVAIVHWLGASSMAVVLGYVGASLVVTLSQLAFLRRTVPQTLTRSSDRSGQWEAQIWAYSAPFCLWGGFTWLHQASDRWSLQTFASTVDVGQYAVLFQLGYAPIAVITGMATSFLGPILYQRSGDATDHSRNANVHQLGWQITYLALAITLLGFVAVSLLHEELVRVLVADTYTNLSHLLPWFVLAGGLFASGQMLAVKLMSELRSAAMISVKIATALVGLLSNIIGSMLAGTVGVVVALVFFSAFYFSWMVLLSRRQMEMNLSAPAR